MEQGWDPEVRKFFLKILNTISTGLIWLLAALTTGLYLGLASHPNKIVLILFYTIFAITLFLLIRYIYRLWNK
jgi:hypothetical protein